MKVIFEQQSNPSGIGFLVKEYIQPYFTSPFHFHDLYELIWIRKSFGKLYAGKSIFNFRDGDFYLFGPGFGHCFFNEKIFIEQGEKAHAVAIFFTKDFLGKDYFENGEYKKIKDLLEKSLFGLQLRTSDNFIRDLFSAITKQKGMDELITFLQLLNQFAAVSAQNIRLLNDHQSDTKMTSKDSERLDPVLKYVMENFREELNSKTAARLTYLNEAAFCRYFKRHMEQTFSQFVNNVRITHAKNLLLKKDWDIMRICYDSGFNSLSYFNRQFREITGQSPKEYRKSFHDQLDMVVMDYQDD